VRTPRPAHTRRAARWRLTLQRAVSHALTPLTASAVAVMLRLGFRYRIEGIAEARRLYREIRTRRRTPLLICANHLTMIDSALIAWALGSPWWYVWRFSALPWNVPEQTNFAATRWQRALAYVFKCLPIARGGSREEVAGVLARLAEVLETGEVGLVFPEGGRSRSGRVEEESAAYGVGRVVRSVPGCQVLCVYLRGDAQETYTGIPARGDRFRVALRVMEPKSHHTGLRGSRDVARQIVRVLAEMEREHFEGRGDR
jgi:1-acyl-sn-glycerol-3-phosphate acyltransferase